MLKKDDEHGYKRRLALLKEKFLQSLEIKCLALARSAQSVGSGDNECLVDIIEISHQLAGSCGTFGMLELGSKARHIEQTALQMREVHFIDSELKNKLVWAVENFIAAFKNLSVGETSIEEESSVGEIQNEEVWLVFDDKPLVIEIRNQLQSFGFSVRVFTSYADCQRELLLSKPALLLAERRLKGEPNSVFEQTELQAIMSDCDVCWMVYSEVDKFEYRVQAVNTSARGYIVEPVDIPSTVAKISHLVDSSRQLGGRVCIVDDDALLAEKYALALERSGIECQAISEPSEIINSILSFRPELVLMDLHMPQYNGTQLAGVIRQYESLRGLPIVYLSAESDLAQQLNAMSYGADDFLLKPISDDELVTAVKVRLARSRDLRSLIERDGLTGLLKHSAIKELASSEIERAKRSGSSLSVVMIDLDKFKLVNDTHGHAVGDSVISTLASLLLKRIRKADKAGRYGGEEFLLVLPESNSENTAAVVESILENFRGIEFRAGSSYFSCTFSAGIASLEKETDTAESILQRADAKLYQAKSLGRNQVLF